MSAVCLSLGISHTLPLGICNPGLMLSLGSGILTWKQNFISDFLKESNFTTFVTRLCTGHHGICHLSSVTRFNFIFVVSYLHSTFDRFL